MLYWQWSVCVLAVLSKVLATVTLIADVVLTVMCFSLASAIQGLSNSDRDYRCCTDSDVFGCCQCYQRPWRQWLTTDVLLTVMCFYVAIAIKGLGDSNSDYRCCIDSDVFLFPVLSKTLAKVTRQQMLCWLWRVCVLPMLSRALATVTYY